MRTSLLRFLKGWCPFANAAATEDVVGTRCYLTKRGWIQRSCDNTLTFFCGFASRHYSAFC